MPNAYLQTTLSRQRSALFRPATATITRRAYTSDGAGGTTETTTTSTAACRLIASGLTPAEREMAERWQVTTVYKVALATTVDVVANDTLTINSVDYNAIEEVKRDTTFEIEQLWYVSPQR